MLSGGRLRHLCGICEIASSGVVAFGGVSVVGAFADCVDATAVTLLALAVTAAAP